jgi:hypothetical protein
MGIFDSIAGVAKTLITQPIKSFVEGAKAVAGVTANPATAITQGVMAAEKKVGEQGIIISSIKSLATIGTVAAGVVAGSSALAGGTVAKVAAKTIAANPVKSVVAAGAGLIGVGVAAKSPTKAAAAITSAPSSLVNFGSNVAGFTENPSLLAAEKILKENPLVSSVVIGAAGVVGAKAATAVANIVTTERNTAALETLANTPPSKQLVNEILTTPKPADEIPINTLVQQSSFTPVTPQTNTISKGTTSKKRKRKTIKTPTSISQRVNVIVSNRSVSHGITNKRYLNTAMYAK